MRESSRFCETAFIGDESILILRATPELFPVSVSSCAFSRMRTRVAGVAHPIDAPGDVAGQHGRQASGAPDLLPSPAPGEVVGPRQCRFAPAVRRRAFPAVADRSDAAERR